MRRPWSSMLALPRAAAILTRRAPRSNEASANMETMRWTGWLPVALLVAATVLYCRAAPPPATPSLAPSASSRRRLRLLLRRRRHPLRRRPPKHAPDSVTRTREQACLRAQEALDHLKQGADFADVVKQY